TMVVEDVKSPATKTAVYRLKKKLVKALYGKAINEVRIAPKKGYYVIEVVYTKVEKQAELKKEYIAGIDVGVDNLIALTANKHAFQAVFVNGRPVKSINQYYNKKRAELQKEHGRTGSTRRMGRLTTRRNRRI